MTTKKTAAKAAPVKPVVEPLPSGEPDNLSPATKPDASGALQEPEIAQRIDTTHPAVDDEPRKSLPAESNQIDFNDPTIDGKVAVERALHEQGAGPAPQASDAAKAD